MSQRPGGVVVLVLLLSLGTAGPVLGVEADGTETEGLVEEEQPGIDEIGTRSTTAEQFLPEPYEQPAWFRFLLYPLLALGVVAVFAVLLVYLKWQPHFAQERRRRRRR